MPGQLIFHPSTSVNIDRYFKKPLHGLLITGERGSGKGAAAKYIAAEILNIVKGRKLEDYAYFYHLASEAGKEISIDSVRVLINNLKLRTPGKARFKRAVLIEDANLLSLEGQNAMLKILEEPPLDTILILTAISDNQLLPTIASRTGKINIAPLRLADVQKISGRASQAKIDSAWKLSKGNAGLFVSLINDDVDHPLKQSVDDAKRFLRSNKYERLLIIDNIVKNQHDLSLFLDGLSRVLGALAAQAIDKKNKRAGDILKSRKLVNDLLNQSDLRVNSKLMKLRLIMDLGI